MVDMAREEHLVRTRTTLALMVALACFSAGHLLLPRVFPFPGDVAQRLALAVQAAAFMLSCLLVAVGMVSIGRRCSRGDIAGAAAGPPSPAIAVKVAFQQNTLEQSVLACGAFLSFAAVAEGAWLALLPVAAAVFCGRRLLFFGDTPRVPAGAHSAWRRRRCLGRCCCRSPSP